jgi:hypothetical protein
MPSPSSILDPAADKNQTELVKIASRFEVPDFVKEAAIEPSMDPIGSGLQIAVTAYADPVRKKFACCGNLVVFCLLSRQVGGIPS